MFGWGDHSGAMDGNAEQRRLALIAQVEERIGPISPRYRDAILSVDRERYVREVDRGLAWIDDPLPLDTPYGTHVATISAPHVYVLAFDALGLVEGDSLLELGSG